MKCRVLDLPAQGVLFNTALDQFLLERASQRQFTIAFTKWQPSVLIGNSQSLKLDVNSETCRENGVGIMRRFSGGQAVYLDENYIVFSLAGPRDCFPAGDKYLDKLRQQLCWACIRALEKLGVPARFSEPDNLIIDQPRERTIGNSGQVIKRDSVLVQASLRYNLTDDSLKTMLAVLKTNGQSLREFFQPAKAALAWIREFTDVGVSEVKKTLVEELLSSYGCRDCYGDGLEPEEKSAVEELAASLFSDMRLEDKPEYRPRGVCYFYLDGRCVVPEIANLLPSVRPSTHLDSTIS